MIYHTNLDQHKTDQIAYLPYILQSKQTLYYRTCLCDMNILWYIAVLCHYAELILYIYVVHIYMYDALKIYLVLVCLDTDSMQGVNKEPL